jgi:AraC family transcriptional regulator, transcriptional activator FtrA
VVAIAYEGLCTFEFGIAVEIFALPRPELGVQWYRFRVCSFEQGPLRATGGILIQADAGPAALRWADTIIIPGWRDPNEKPPDAPLRALCAADRRGARLVSICSGVFVLAATGLLDGKRATTHWRYVDQLKAKFPKVQVQPDVLYVDEGNILTSAGSAAGLDLCLHLVRLDFGAEVANTVARRLVIPPHRDGGQAQYIPDSFHKGASGGLATLLQWAQAHLDQPLSVNALARKAALSPRTLARRFREEAGTTPHRWLTYQRLLMAQRRLETTQKSIDDVAEAAGFGTATTLRQHFQRAFDTTPTAYRRRFAMKPQ